MKKSTSLNWLKQNKILTPSLTFDTIHPEERGRRAEGSFFVRNIWEALDLKRCLRCRHDKQFNVCMSKHLLIYSLTGF